MRWAVKQLNFSPLKGFFFKGYSTFPAFMEGNPGSSCLGAPGSSLHSQIPHSDQQHLRGRRSSSLQVCKNGGFYTTTMFSRCFLLLLIKTLHSSFIYAFWNLLVLKQPACTSSLTCLAVLVEFWCFEVSSSFKTCKFCCSVVFFHKVPCSLLNWGGKTTKSLLVLNNFSWIYGSHCCLCTSGILDDFSKWFWQFLMG